MAEFYSYLDTLFWGWLGILLVADAVAALIARVTKREVPRWIFLYFAFGAVFAAGYLAWSEEHAKVVANSSGGTEASSALVDALKAQTRTQSSLLRRMNRMEHSAKGGPQSEEHLATLRDEVQAMLIRVLTPEQRECIGHELGDDFKHLKMPDFSLIVRWQKDNPEPEQYAKQIASAFKDKAHWSSVTGEPVDDYLGTPSGLALYYPNEFKWEYQIRGGLSECGIEFSKVHSDARLPENTIVILVGQKTTT